MSKGWNYNSPDWYVTCDVCGKKMKASKARHRWDGYLVCDADFEHRHAQDFIRTRPDNLTVPFQRPKETPVYVDVTYTQDTLTCTPMSRFAITGVAVTGCTITGNLMPGDL